MGKSEQAVMLVTQDKYQLPLAVAGSSAELGRILGVSRVAIDSYIVHAKKNKNKLPKYIRVYLEDEDITNEQKNEMPCADKEKY